MQLRKILDPERESLHIRINPDVKWAQTLRVPIVRILIYDAFSSKTSVMQGRLIGLRAGLQK
ncbi:hypothetical protein FORC37_2751 [Vibrio vulnificus]|nr:hypothetical protein FORC37_2751 [Vibrio vulnificus]